MGSEGRGGKVGKTTWNSGFHRRRVLGAGKDSLQQFAMDGLQKRLGKSPLIKENKRSQWDKTEPPVTGRSPRRKGKSINHKEKFRSKGDVKIWKPTGLPKGESDLPENYRSSRR